MRETRTSTRGLGSRAENGGAARQSPAGAGPWAAVDMAVRRHALRELFVERAPTAAIANKIDKARSDRDALSEPTCMLVTGETGVGKSAFLKHYAAGCPSRREAGCLVQPVVYVELQSKMTLLSAAKALARVGLTRFGGRFGGLRTTSWPQRLACRLHRPWASGSPVPNGAVPGCTSLRCS